MHLFYSPNLSNPPFFLDDIESAHCVRVLRLQKGDRMRITDGKGKLVEAIIVEAIPRRCSFEIGSVLTPSYLPEFHLHIAIAPIKNIARFEFFLEKATEIGISEISPIICERSERRVLNNSRLEKLLISAMKQSGGSTLPILNPMRPYKEVIASTTEQHRFLAHCISKDLQNISDSYIKGQSALLLIGPEGDFSTEETSLAKSSGFREITIGKSTLRTETAGIVGCLLLNLLNTE